MSNISTWLMIKNSSPPAPTLPHSANILITSSSHGPFPLIPGALPYSLRSNLPSPAGLGREYGG